MKEQERQKKQKEQKEKREQKTRLTLLLSASALDSSAMLAASQGFFTLANLPVIVFVFLIGPGALLSALLLKGTLPERVQTSLVAGVLATTLLCAATAVGPRLLTILHLPILKITTALTLISIAGLITDVPLSPKLPLTISSSGMVLSVFVKILQSYIS